VGNQMKGWSYAVSVIASASREAFSGTG
jgi:hypothetical protein